jgi:hypothetical protein
MKAVLEGISEDFSRETEIALEHVTATWEFFLPGHYAVAGKAEEQQPRPALPGPLGGPGKSHPILVDLLTPDFNDAKTIERMLKCIAKSLAKRAGILPNNIFINHRQAHSGMVFDNGEIVRW